MKSFIATLLSCALMLPALGAMPLSADATETNPLYGKSVLFVGDSICEAACEWGTSTVGWADRIIQWNSMTGLNKGLSGASISNVRGSNTVLNQLITQKGVDYDYVIIEGGGNDAWDSAPVGKITKGFEGDFDMTTFAGGLETTFKYAKENFPNSTIGFIVTFQMPSATVGRMSDMSEYFAEAKLICDKWEIPYIDFYFDQDFNDNVMKSATLENLVDYIHPNTSGYDILSPRINDWMKTLDTNAVTSENIARYKPYTISGTGEGFYYVSDEYGTMDYRADLTDEKAAEAELFDSNWFGFYNGELPDLNTVDGVGTVIVDLEKQATMEGFSIHFWNCDGANMKAPAKATVSVSEDGKEFTEIGDLNITTTTDTMYWADLQASASGRYVKFDITLQSLFCFLNEIKIIGTLIDDGNSGSDITVDTNVALNKSYTVSGSGDGFYYEYEDGTISQYQAKLTDGINSDFQNFNNEWFGFYNGTATEPNTVNGIGTIIIDLEDNYDIYSVRAHLWNSDGAGACAPYSINISVSENGVDFVNAGSVEINYTTDTIYWGKAMFTAKGRYVKLDFQLQSMFAFVNEIHVYGTLAQEDKYKDKVNVALEKGYTVSGSGEGFYYVNEDGSVSQYQAALTDGLASDDQLFGNDWFGFYRGTATAPNAPNGLGTLVFDLEGKFDITDMRIHFWNCDGASASSPYVVTVSVSDDGSNFTAWGDMPLNYSDNTVYWSEAEMNLTGRYVKFDFQLQSTFAILNEIEIYGTPSQESGDGGEGEQETPVTPEYVSGDINNDGKLTATDYFMLKKLCFQTLDIKSLDAQETAMLRSDLNGDEKITATDYFMLKRRVFTGA